MLLYLALHASYRWCYILAHCRVSTRADSIGQFTGLECGQGLEFDDVMLLNFFADSPANKEWRVLLTYLEELEASVSVSFRTCFGPVSPPTSRCKCARHGEMLKSGRCCNINVLQEQ